MAQEKPLTPERQLLNLIEGSASGKEKFNVEVIKHQSLSFFSIGAWIGRISFYKQGFAHWLKSGGFRQFDIKTLNKILGACIVVLLIYFISTLSVSVLNLKKIPDLIDQGTIHLKPAVFKEPEVTKVVSYYLEKVRGRDIFKMGSKKTTDNSGAAASKGPSSRLTEAVQGLKLVGISWSNDPDVMIEDTKAQRTYFLKKGQVLDNLNLKIEAVFKDKIILSCEGEEIELR
jgi:hypothetical protein